MNARGHFRRESEAFAQTLEHLGWRLGVVQRAALDGVAKRQAVRGGGGGENNVVCLLVAHAKHETELAEVVVERGTEGVTLDAFLEVGSEHVLEFRHLRVKLAAEQRHRTNTRERTLRAFELGVVRQNLFNVLANRADVTRRATFLVQRNGAVDDAGDVRRGEVLGDFTGGVVVQIQRRLVVSRRRDRRGVNVSDGVRFGQARAQQLARVVSVGQVDLGVRDAEHALPREQKSRLLFAKGLRRDEDELLELLA